jgi:hypothetical protein
MQIVNKLSSAGMGLILMLFTNSGWSLMTANQQGGVTPQQLAEVQPKKAQSQKIPLENAEPRDGAFRAESASDQPAQSNAPIGEPIQGKATQQSIQPQQHGVQNSGGTAAAEPEKTSGIAASRPSGVAIAPAKQHRRRAFWVKVGAIMGAGVAVGTTFALSRSSSGRPPGSH